MLGSQYNENEKEKEKIQYQLLLSIVISFFVFVGPCVELLNTRWEKLFLVFWCFFAIFKLIIYKISQSKNFSIQKFFIILFLNLFCFGYSIFVIYILFDINSSYIVKCFTIVNSIIFNSYQIWLNFKLWRVFKNNNPYEHLLDSY